jgi:phage recombination protein Bet
MTQNLPQQLDSATVELVKRTVAQQATTEELQLFLYDCQRRGVHPLDRLIHFTKRKGRYVPVTGIDFLRSRAAGTGEYAGSDDAVMGPAIGQSNAPQSASVTVYRLVQGQQCQFSATARWIEYYPGDGDVGIMWRKMPATMLSKCAEALALRKAFPAELAGLYVREEMDQAGPMDNQPTREVEAPAPVAQDKPATLTATEFARELTRFRKERGFTWNGDPRLVTAFKRICADYDGFDGTSKSLTDTQLAHLMATLWASDLKAEPTPEPSPDAASDQDFDAWDSQRTALLDKYEVPVDAHPRLYVKVCKSIFGASFAGGRPVGATRAQLAEFLTRLEAELTGSGNAA